MPITHLISGLPCSGKTTYATRLGSERDGVLFSLDTWLITAYGPYSIHEVGHEEHVRRVTACRTLIWHAASEFLRRGVDVILDDGFFLREHRMQSVALSREFGAAATIHLLDVPLAVLRSRLEARNANLPRYNFRIDPDLLERFVGLFEIPASEEGAELVRVAADPFREVSSS